MHCPDCSTSPTTVHKTTLPCQCIHCTTCLSSWILERLSKAKFDSADIKVICPNCACLKPFDLSKVMDFLPENVVKEIVSLLSTKGLNFQKNPLEDRFVSTPNDNQPKQTKLQFYHIMSQTIELAYASCPICHRITEKNVFCFNRLCYSCEAKYCWVCRGSETPYSYCVGKACDRLRMVRFIVQILFLVLFVQFSGILNFMTESWGNFAHLGISILAMFILSKIIFMYLFYHRKSQSDPEYLLGGLVISSLIILFLPIAVLIKALMMKIGINIILGWVFPPVVA